MLADCEVRNPGCLGSGAGALSGMDESTEAIAEVLLTRVGMPITGPMAGVELPPGAGRIFPELGGEVLARGEAFGKEEPPAQAACSP